AGVADAEPDPAILVADVRRDRSQAVMSRNAATDLDPNLRRRKLDLVVKHHDIAFPELEELRRVLNRVAGFVHVGRGLEQDDTLSIEGAFGCLTLKAAAPWCETVTPRNFIDSHEPDIVP